MLNHGILTGTLVATVPPRSSERFRDPRIVCLPRNDDVPSLASGTGALRPRMALHEDCNAAENDLHPEHERAGNECLLK
jgi:hypothetical protein